MVKQKNIAMCILFSIITCGIYGIYWFVCMTDDANEVAQVDETSGVLAFIFNLITCGIYGIYWAYKMGEKIDRAKQNRRIPSSNTGILFVILYLISCGLITYAIIQYELNRLAEPQY